MEEKFDPNDLHINVIKKKDEEVLFDSDCCSCMTLVLTADGRLATSFFGLHTPEVVKSMKKITNEYYSKLIKEFKKQYKEEKAKMKNIKVLQAKNPDVTNEALAKIAEELRAMQEEKDKDKK